MLARLAVISLRSSLRSMLARLVFISLRSSLRSMLARLADGGQPAFLDGGGKSRRAVERLG